jgi:hypothetical protein
MTLAEANVLFKSSGVDSVNRDIDSVGNKLDNTAKKAQNASISIQNIAAGNVIGNILQRLGDGVFDLGKNILEMGMNFQTTNAQFQALGMNANSTRDFITKVAAASTLTTKELVALSQSIQLSGFNIYRVLPAFGKLADLAGKDQDKLQGMVRLLNVLKTGAKPDQELLQSLKLPTLLAEAGLKFDKGKLVGDINSALEAVIKVIEGKTKGVSNALGKTFEASFSSLVDQFDKLKESLGNKILEWLKPWVDSLRVVLQALVSSGVWDRVLNQFFNRGYEANKKVIAGITSPEGLQKIANFVANVTAFFAFLPARLEIIFKAIGPVVKEFFTKLQEDPTIKGFFAIFRKIGELESQASKSEKINQALITLEKKGIITKGESIAASAGYASEDTQKLLNQYMMVQERNKNRRPALEGMFSQLEGITGKQNKFAAQNAMTLRGELERVLKSTGQVQGTGAVTLPGTMLGDPTNVEKDKKSKEKQASLLELIVQNTSKANELTLRNLTYGGGQLASLGISQTQIASNRSVKSPQINASNDITRGVEKIVRGYANSNNLNFSFRRS